MFMACNSMHEYNLFGKTITTFLNCMHILSSNILWNVSLVINKCCTSFIKYDIGMHMIEILIRYVYGL